MSLCQVELSRIKWEDRNRVIMFREAIVAICRYALRLMSDEHDITSPFSFFIAKLIIACMLYCITTAVIDKGRFRNLASSAANLRT